VQVQSLDAEFARERRPKPLWVARRAELEGWEKWPRVKAPPRFAESATVTVKSSFAPRATRLV